MRHLTLLTLSVATLAVSACGMMKDDGPSPADQAKKAETTPAAAAVSPSAQEEKELSAVMGKDATSTAMTVETDSTTLTPDAASPAPADAVTAEDVPPPPEDKAPATVADITGGDSPKADMADASSSAAAAGPAPANAPKECPGVEVLPDTKSITYFDDPEGKPSGELIARAALSDIKGGCDYTSSGVVVDIDMIMQGKITDKGRYEGRKDLEAFMTFPYFVAVMDPDGKMIDKKIMATAMRFKPEINDLDHAEKITQTIPLSDITKGPQYTITVGFQLNRAQLDYNRGKVSESPKTIGKAGAKKEPAEPTKAEGKKPDVKAPAKTSVKPSDEKMPSAKSAAGATPSSSSETATKPAEAQPATKSQAAKMSPIVE